MGDVCVLWCWLILPRMCHRLDLLQKIKHKKKSTEMQFVVQLKSNLSGSCVYTDAFLFCNKTKIDDTTSQTASRIYNHCFFVTLLGEGFLWLLYVNE